MEDHEHACDQGCRQAPPSPSGAPGRLVEQAARELSEQAHGAKAHEEEIAIMRQGGTDRYHGQGLSQCPKTGHRVSPEQRRQDGTHHDQDEQGSYPPDGSVFG